MKHLCLSLLLFFSIFSIHAQDKNDADATTNFNEVKINALYLVLGAFEVTYERTLNEESAFGASVFIPFDEDVNEDINFYLSPYYRLYFGKRYASGFFIEGFGLLSSLDRTEINIRPVDSPDPIFEARERNIIDFALGIGLGGKWVTNSGFIGELSLGVGRNLFNTDDIDDDFVGKIGITLGYRF